MWHTSWATSLQLKVASALIEDSIKTTLLPLLLTCFSTQVDAQCCPAWRQGSQHLVSDSFPVLYFLFLCLLQIVSISDCCKYLFIFYNKHQSYVGTIISLVDVMRNAFYFSSPLLCILIICMPFCTAHPFQLISYPVTFLAGIAALYNICLSDSWSIGR